MFLYFFEISNIYWFLIISSILSILILLLARFLSPRLNYMEKISAYECGFYPFNTARINIDVSFAIIAILFLVFDLEIIYLIPWVMNLMNLGILSFCISYIFLFILMLGFFFEILRNVLDWTYIFR